LQLVGLQVNQILVKVANIYCPSSSSKPEFLDQVSDLLSMIGQAGNKRLIVCGDFNLPGDEAACIDERLASLLDIHGYQRCWAQHSPTVKS